MITFAVCVVVVLVVLGLVAAHIAGALYEIDRLRRDADETGLF